MKFAEIAVASAIAMAAIPVCAEIQMRGVVEGYYGRPWGTEGRLSLLEFMGKEKMNVFIYGPKDDPYHHSKWREPYPESEMADFRKLLSCAKKNGVDFYWAIHLGGGFKKGSEEDYSALFRKLGLMYDAGFRSFAVFFDDFGGADAAFHAEICNRIVKEFFPKHSGCSPLIMCPNVYWGTGNPYQKTLGEKLDMSVRIMWTGGWICSDIREEDVKKITADFRRPPFIWWNWPVNDYCRSKVLLGRTYGLDHAGFSGFVSNPMENCEANKIALHGIAAWCRDPGKFDSVKNWEESFALLYPDPKIAKAMRIFAEHNSDQGPNGHGYRREESVAAAPLCARAREEYTAGGKLSPKTAAELKSLFRKVGKASRTLLKELPKDKGLGWELQGWFEAEEYQMAQGLKAIELMEAKDPKARSKAVAALKKIRAKAAVAVEAHREKFAAATFDGDKGHIRVPEASTTELKPVVMMILEGELRKMYSAKTGADFDAADGFAAFAPKSCGKTLQTNRDGKYAGIVRVLENIRIAPDESFGLSVPAKWETDYFHAKLGSGEPAKHGIIELSKDGKTWTKLDSDIDGEQMQKRLPVEAGWRHARYRNTSGEPVDVKVNLFKFDVRGVQDSIDSLLEEL
ncbi:MAG: beta-N-acetylglucosaminidase domain-containing protein [Kiritimatiellae bacterium]|nr:beta-N-acetylglucosaminidase domain-containing protein [Kiritimatiellia bacterium]